MLRYIHVTYRCWYHRLEMSQTMKYKPFSVYNIVKHNLETIRLHQEFSSKHIFWHNIPEAFTKHLTDKF